MGENYKTDLIARKELQAHLGVLNVEGVFRHIARTFLRLLFLIIFPAHTFT